MNCKQQCKKYCVPISFEKNPFEDDVHHALYLHPLFLQLLEASECIKIRYSHTKQTFSPPSVFNPQILPPRSSSASSPVAGSSVSPSSSSARCTASDCFRSRRSGSEPRSAESSATSPLDTHTHTFRSKSQS